MQVSHERHDHQQRHRYCSRLCARQHRLIIAFLLAAFVIGWFIGRLRERRRGQHGEE